MDRFEKLFGQNWIEQYRQNIAVMPTRRTCRTATSLNEGANVWDFPDLVNYGFCWEDTEEGREIWENRYYRREEVNELLR